MKRAPPVFSVTNISLPGGRNGSSLPDATISGGAHEGGIPAVDSVDSSCLTGTSRPLSTQNIFDDWMAKQAYATSFEYLRYVDGRCHE